MTLDSDAIEIARAGIRAADPAAAVSRVLRTTTDGISVGGHRLRVPGGSSVRIVAIGKAAAAMADSAARTLPRTASGFVAVPRGYPPPRRAEFRDWACGEHPVPGRGSFRAGARALEFLRSLGPDDPVLFLLSGGGSATVELPQPGLSRGDVSATHRLLVASDARIGEMNTVRRHLSAVKGGRLGLAVPSRRFATIAVSDVVGDSPGDIASGPTVGDPSTFSDALEVVGTHRLRSRLPSRIVDFLVRGMRGREPETPDPGDPRLSGRPYVLAATNAQSVRAAAEAAQRLGYAVHRGSSRTVGETRPIAQRFASSLLRGARFHSKFAVVAGGETTVTLGSRPGLGGRNQEFALAAASVIAGAPALVLSAGTDGVDGPTDAAGGWVDSDTLARARARGVDLGRALRTHATYRALERLDQLWRPGPTGTNVMDLHVGLAVRPRAPAASRGRGGSSPRRAAPSSRRTRS